MRWFGPHGEEPPFLTDDLEHIPTPVGIACDRCHESIESEDFGMVLPLLSDGGKRDAAFYHYECHARQIIGSVAHQNRKCSCYVKGSTCDEPPGMTLREAAKAALTLYVRRSRN